MCVEHGYARSARRDRHLSRDRRPGQATLRCGCRGSALSQRRVWAVHRRSRIGGGWPWSSRWRPPEVARWTGLLAAAMLVPALPLAPFWGALADRYGRKPVILRGYLANVLGYLIAAVSPNVEMLVLGRLAFGLGFGTQAVALA